MAEKKADLLEAAQAAGLDVSEKNTVAEIKAALDSQPKEEVGKDEAGLAKAGKRSKKGQTEAEAKAEKLARQKSDAKEAVINGAAEERDSHDKRGPAPKTRALIDRRGRKYREAAKLIDQTKTYELNKALELASKTSTTKFDSTVELHFNLGVDPKQADQNIRGTVALPSGTGRTLRVAVFADDEDVKKAKAAGADVAGNEEFLQKLQKEELDFDVLIATPEVMVKLAQFAKLLGPKGLMPNPKSGTVTKEIAAAVKASKAGKVEFRVDKQGIIHCAVGKASFKPEALDANAKALVKAIQDARPASIKGIYLKSLVVTTTMGPSVKIDLKAL